MSTGSSTAVDAAIESPEILGWRVIIPTDCWRFTLRFQPEPHAVVDQDSRTLVESVPQGWFHTALLPSGERLVTYFTDAGTPWAKTATSREGFLALIQDTVHIVPEAGNSRLYHDRETAGDGRPQ